MKKIFLVTFLENLADQPLNRIASILDYSIFETSLIHLESSSAYHLYQKIYLLLE